MEQVTSLALIHLIQGIANGEYVAGKSFRHREEHVGKIVCRGVLGFSFLIFCFNVFWELCWRNLW